MFDRLRVSVAEAMAAQKRDELELACQVDFLVEMRPERTRGLVAVDPAQRFGCVVTNLRLSRIEQGRNRGHQTRVGDDRAGTGKDERFLRRERLTPGFQQLRGCELGRQGCQQAKFLLGAQAGGMLGSQPYRDEPADSVGIQLDKCLAGRILKLRQRVKRHCLEEMDDIIFPIRRHQTGDARQPRGGFRQGRGCAAVLEPASRRWIFQARWPSEPRASISATRAATSGPAVIERTGDRLGDLETARTLRRRDRRQARRPACERRLRASRRSCS